MSALNDPKRELEEAAIGLARSKKLLLQAIGVPENAKLTAERLPSTTRLTIEIPRD